MLRQDACYDLDESVRGLISIPFAILKTLRYAQELSSPYYHHFSVSHIAGNRCVVGPRWAERRHQAGEISETCAFRAFFQGRRVRGLIVESNACPHHTRSEYARKGRRLHASSATSSLVREMAMQDNPLQT